MMTELKAIQIVTAEYHPLLRAAGLMPHMARIRQAADDAAVFAVADELNKHPAWQEYMAAVERQRISEECHDAFERYRGYMARGEDDSAEAYGAFMRAYETAPEWLQAEFDAKARELDLIPDPTGYLDNGTAMVSLDAVAAKLGLSEKEAQDSIEEFIAARVVEGLPVDGIVTDGSLIHRVQ